MNSKRPNNTLAVIGLVLGILALVFSVFPCLGMLAFIPGIIGLILGVIALLQAKDNGDPKGMAIAVLVVSGLACAVSGFQMAALGNMASGMKPDMKEYASCDEVSKAYDSTKLEMETLTKEMEEGSPSFASIKKITKLGITLGHIQEESRRLECDMEFDDFDPSVINEAKEEGESEGETDGEIESIKEEEGN